jgi:dihydroflavonol-4-reductase
MRDAEAVRRAMQGARCVMHVAANYRLWARDPRDIFETNVSGAETIMGEALRAGVERVVYTSSVATLATSARGGLAREEDQLGADQAVGAYKQSKVAAERLVENFARAHHLPVVIVNPSTPVGPRDIRPTPTGRILLEAARGRMPAYVDTGLNFAHVDDVAEGHVAALERGRLGERYILGGENIALSQVLHEVATRLGRRPPRVRLPHAACYPIALASEIMALATNREPLATRIGLHMSKNYMYYDDSKARRELGYRSRPWSVGVADALDWFAAAGYLKKS